MKNILTKLNKIQTTLKAPKGQMNNFGGYKYRSCEDIMEAVKPLLAEHGCVLTIEDSIISTDNGYRSLNKTEENKCASTSIGSFVEKVEEEKAEGVMAVSNVERPEKEQSQSSTITTLEEVEETARTYIKATAYLYDIETGEVISTTAFAREAYNKKGMDESQITGAASSYARKYALNGLFAIDDTKDADTQDNTKQSALTDSLKKKIDSITDRDDLVKLYEKSTDKQVRDYITKRGEAINAG